EILKRSFQKEAIPFQTVDFPQYETSFYGKMIARFLRGEFGPLEQINPYLISVLYANDRGSAKEKMYKWLSDGNYILSNRYATSSMAHQAGRLPLKERDAFINWLEELEYEETGIPREDIVLYLDVPFTTAQQLMHNEDREQAYRKGAKKDMVEKNTDYLKHSSEMYSWLAEKFPHWVRIACLDHKGKLLSKEVIHEEIKNVLAKKGILR
ncbi:MAG: hypothetical protein ACREHC_07055, partial [Candidatus Levyibacteriota bacterium]